MGVLQKTSLYYNISKLLMNYYVKSIFISSISKEPYIKCGVLSFITISNNIIELFKNLVMSISKD